MTFIGILENVIQASSTDDVPMDAADDDTFRQTIPNESNIPHLHVILFSKNQLLSNNKDANNSEL